MDKLYTKIEKQSTLKEFLEKFFSHPKVYTKYITGHATYYDEECTRMHCHQGRYRSFDDLLILVNTYYDNITPEELIHNISILRIYHEGIEYSIYCGTCGDIQRIKMLFLPSGMHISFNGIKYQSKYSWKELFAMINIYCESDYLKYRENYYKNLEKSKNEEI